MQKILLSFVLVAISSPVALAAPESKPGFLIMQRSHFLGRRDVYLTDSAFKAINPVTGHILITTAPDWQVLIANSRSKLYFLTPFETWLGRKVAVGERTVSGMTAKQARPVKGERIICGLKATKMAVNSTGLEKRYFSGVRDINDFDLGEYWVTNDLPFPRKARNTICTFYQLPMISGFPLEATYRRSKKDMDVQHLQTTEVKRKSIDSSIFTVPQNFKRANFEAEVWVDDKTRLMLEIFR